MILIQTKSSTTPIVKCLQTLSTIVLLLLGMQAYAGTAASGLTVRSQGEGSAAVVEGTACGASVTLYAGFDVPSGQFIATGPTHGPSLGACAEGVLRNFKIELNDNQIFRYGGLKLYGRSGSLATGVAILGSGTVSLPSWRPGNGQRICDVSDFDTLDSCVQNIRNYDVLRLQADLTCAKDVICCPAGKRALIHWQGLRDKVLDGHGHTIHRLSAQAQCPTIWLQDVKDVLVKDLQLDENLDSPACELTDKNCAPTIRVDTSNHVGIHNTQIYSGKGYVVRVWKTDGFAISDSVISESGIIGLYVGHFLYGASRNLSIVNNVIARSRTNGIALQGVVGEDGEPVLVMGNTLNQNHWHGLWPVQGVPRGITPGGQIFLANGENVRITENVIANGRCENCNPPRPLTAIELSQANMNVKKSGVSNVLIDHNQLLNGSGMAIYQNPSSLLSGLKLHANYATGFSVLDVIVSPVERVKNTLTNPSKWLGDPIKYHFVGEKFSPSPKPHLNASPLFLCTLNDIKTERCSEAKAGVFLGFQDDQNQSRLLKKH